MKQDQWDAIIQDKLKDFKVEDLPKDWDIFEEKLTLSQGEPAEMPEEEFDQIVFDQLNQFKASAWLKEQHWQLFERQMYFLANLRQRLLQYKLIEVMALTLLLLYVVEVEAPGTHYQSPAASNSLQASGPEKEHTGKEHTAVAAPAEESTANINFHFPETGTKPNESLRATPTDPLQSIINDIGQTTPTRILAPSNSQLTDINSMAGTPPMAPLSMAPASVEPHQANKAFPASPAPKTPLTLLDPLSDLAFTFSSNNTPQLRAQFKPKPAMEVQISMLGGADYNRVMTPENLSKGIRAFERYSAGYRGGLLADFGRQNGRLHLGSGFIYTAKQYEVGYQRINGSFLRRGSLTAESLKNIELNMVNVPVFARFDFWQDRRWSLFAQGGMALQMALQANYYVGYPQNLPQPVGVNQTPSRYSQISDRTGGLLEGGSFKQNSFFTGHLGLGAERQMADRWSMFFQSRYEHSIGYFSTGLGPTQDRINTISLETGIRVRLK